MSDLIHVAILDDHQSIIDGYLYRLAKDPGIEVVATMHYGEELESVLAQHTIDALLLDIQVPTSEANTNPYPILYLIPKLVHVYPKLNILVISMHNQNSLIRAVMDAGASGYILKDDQSAIKTLPSLIRTVTGGGIYLSQHIYQQLRKREKDPSSPTLTVRQLEALSLCAAYPNASAVHAP